MNIRLIFSGRDRNVLHALPAVLWLGSCLYLSLSLLNALPPVISDSSPLSLKNIGVVGLCMLVMYPVYRLGYMLISRTWPGFSVIKRIAIMSLACVLLGAAVMVATLIAVDLSEMPRQQDINWYLLNLFIGIVLMPIFFFLVRGADTVREQFTGSRTGAIKLLLRKAGPDAGTKLVRLQSADHYVELHTDRGAKLLLMRISDAIELLSGAEGGQVHRSHWVNFDEIEGVVKQDRKIWLRMSDGAEVPVSRTYRAPLRQAGMI